VRKPRVPVSAWPASEADRVEWLGQPVAGAGVKRCSRSLTFPVDLIHIQQHALLWKRPLEPPPARNESMMSQTLEIERIVGPPLRQSIIELTGSPVLHRTTWICGCSADFTDRETSETQTLNPSLRWHQCVYHRKLVQRSTAG
jgi:hypothetical protein